MRLLKKELVIALIAISLALSFTYQVNAENDIQLAVEISDYEIKEAILSELTQSEELKITEQARDYLMEGTMINLGGARFRLKIEIKDLEKEEIIYQENITGEKAEIIAEVSENNIKELEAILLSYPITGKVVDETGEGIKGVEIFFSESSYDSLYSDSDGYWKKDNLVKAIEAKVQKDGWEFAPERIKLSRSQKEVVFQGREEPYLDQLEVEFKADEFYEANEYKFEVVGYDQYGAYYEIAPDWKVWGGIGELTYLSSRKDEVLFKATEKGRGTIEIETDGLSKEIELEVLREPAYLAELKLEAERESLGLGDEAEMNVKAFDQYGQEYESDFYWSSNDDNLSLEKIAGAKNKVTGLEKGEAEVIVRAKDLESKVQLEVLGLDKVEIMPDQIELVEGQEYQLEAIGFDQQGNQIEINPQWRIVEGSGEIETDGSKAIYQAKDWGETRLEVVEDDIFNQAKIEVEMLKSWSINLGSNYNTYNLAEFNEVAEARGANSINSGAGFYLGAKRWLNQIEFIDQQLPELARDIALGVEIERMSLSYNDLEVGDDLTLSNTGFLLTGKYDFLDELSLNLALGQYWAKEVHAISGGERSNNAFSPGVKVGVEFSLPLITNQLNLNCRANYRFGEVGNYDFSGAEISLLTEIVF